MRTPESSVPVRPSRRTAGSLATLTTFAFLATLVTLVTLAAEAWPSPLHAQDLPAIHAPPLAPTTLVERCGTRRAPDPFVEQVGHLMIDPAPWGDVEAVLASLQTEALHGVEAVPDDPGARYRLVAVLGARTDRADGKRQLALADSLHEQVTGLLELEPRHPGAHHVLGRLHAAVMRLGGFQRFLAKHLMDGEILDAASWEGARLHLEAAERGDPCTPAHHYELARLYVERRQLRSGWEEVGHVLALTSGDRERWAALRRKAEALTDGN